MRVRALLVFFILAWAMVLGPKLVRMSPSAKTIRNSASAKPAQHQLKTIMFRRIG
jgi:hypothetical protein